MDPKFATEVETLSRLIDELDYYQILRVPKNASLGQVRKAYHEQSLKFHPDRFFGLPEGALKSGIKKIAKRVAEAYVTLRDASKRRAYDLQLQRLQSPSPAAPESAPGAPAPAAAPPATALRFTEQTEKAFKQEKQQQFGKTEKGRKLYQQGMREFQAKNFVAAERTFKMALAYEPDNELFAKLRDEAGRNIKTDYTIK
ncbi:MAG: J domain-containing protein [Myxococcales bacterium]|nr:J domain-containing protein [Myxococcales bacterium]